ncbi:hypothetical protein D3C77_321190 [compost metagenome]
MNRAQDYSWILMGEVPVGDTQRSLVLLHACDACLQWMLCPKPTCQKAEAIFQGSQLRSFEYLNRVFNSLLFLKWTEESEDRVIKNY